MSNSHHIQFTKKFKLDQIAYSTKGGLIHIWLLQLCVAASSTRLIIILVLLTPEANVDPDSAGDKSRLITSPACPVKLCIIVSLRPKFK